MSSFQLTYDTQEDRLLLKTGMSVSWPTWWLSRRMVNKIFNDFNRVISVQFEMKEILEKMATQSREEADPSGAPSHDQGKHETLNDYHNSLLSHSNLQVDASKNSVTGASQYPFARGVVIEIIHNNHVRMVLTDNNKRGVKLEFTEEGAHRFINMVCNLYKRCGW